MDVSKQGPASHYKYFTFEYIYSGAGTLSYINNKLNSEFPTNAGFPADTGMKS